MVILEKFNSDTIALNQILLKHKIMPTEDRRIIFQNDEIYKALYTLCHQKQLRKPKPGTLTGVIEDKGDPSKIYILLENAQDKTASQQEFSRDFLAAALMLYCQGLNIPLPKKAKKTVLIKDTTAMLRVMIS